VQYYGGSQGATFLGYDWLNSAGVPGWQVVGANDFNGDGTPDLVWQNDTTRQLRVDFYGGPQHVTPLGSAMLNASGNPGWQAIVPR